MLQQFLNQNLINICHQFTCHAKNQSELSLLTPVLFLTQGTRFVKFVKQVFPSATNILDECRNRWHLIDRAEEGGRKSDNTVEKQSNESHKGVPLYVCTAFPLFYHTLLPSRQSHPSLPTFADTPVVQKKKKKARLFVCSSTVIWPWMLASTWQLMRKQKAGKATQKMCLWLKQKNKTKSFERFKTLKINVDGGAGWLVVCVWDRHCRFCCLSYINGTQQKGQTDTFTQTVPSYPQQMSTARHEGGNICRDGWAVTKALRRRDWQQWKYKHKKQQGEQRRRGKERTTEIKAHKREWERIRVCWWWRWANESPTERATNMTDDDVPKKGMLDTKDEKEMGRRLEDEKIGGHWPNDWQ